ncbi:hypothetical protein AB6A40_009809 [Gnathostoma spinigerum]|uniref:Uncharacterized protein n=1 Tax=Gnathostoma spinigerum TaxID=75299 RepID=A0ABD6F270_9BILA
MDTDNYVNYLLSMMSASGGVRTTCSGIMKQVGYAAGGCCVGGLTLGPPGALMGTVVGAAIGYSQADDYESFLTIIRNLSASEKEVLTKRVQELVGSVSLEDLSNWIKSDGHQALLIALLRQMTKKSSR